MSAAPHAVPDAPPVTRILGDWIAGLEFDDIPAASIAHAKRCLLDAIGCGLYGGQQEWGRIAAAVARDLSGDGPGGGNRVHDKVHRYPHVQQP